MSEVTVRNNSFTWLFVLRAFEQYLQFNEPLRFAVDNILIRDSENATATFKC